MDRWGPHTDNTEVAPVRVELGGGEIGNGVVRGEGLGGGASRGVHTACLALTAESRCQSWNSASGCALSG